MEAATNGGVVGIIGECGGSAMCGTCHVYLTATDFEKLTPVEPLESEALEFIATDARPTSRLGCQVRLTEAMDGLVFYVATG
jgi:2Fe-2S ferredoxin